MSLLDTLLGTEAVQQKLLGGFQNFMREKNIDTCVLKSNPETGDLDLEMYEPGEVVIISTADYDALNVRALAAGEVIVKTPPKSANKMNIKTRKKNAKTDIKKRR